jgi:hypothetical protein
MVLSLYSLWMTGVSFFDTLDRNHFTNFPHSHLASHIIQLMDIDPRRSSRDRLPGDIIGVFLVFSSWYLPGLLSVGTGCHCVIMALLDCLEKARGEFPYNRKNQGYNCEPEESV